jgi:glutathione peroxidase
MLPLLAFGAALVPLCMTPGLGEGSPSAAQSVHDFTVKDMKGQDVALSKCKGDVLMIVNVASRWGFTETQYSGLESIYKKYKDQGFKVLAFPANNFGGQEPGTNQEIESFCRNQMKVTFDVFGKISVEGADQAPLYAYLTGLPGEGLGGKITWNFNKFLVGRDGKVIARFGTRTSPTDETVTKAIEAALRTPPPK